MTSPPLRVVAIVSVYNEADILEQTTRDLIDQGVVVHVLDNGSTDGSADTIRHLLGRGVAAIESFPDHNAEETRRFRLRRILARKEELARTLDADWLINHDVDELREAPWSSVRLVEALSLVDRLGWNAVDFEVLNFWPTHDDFRPGDDLRETFRHFAPAEEWDRLQVRCWKRQPAVDLVSSGGHEAQFDGRTVFPIRFLLRHYPIRSQAHGERKVLQERQAHYDPDEVADGWHVHYRDVTAGTTFIRDPSAMTVYDPEAVRVRLCLNHRGLEEAAASRAALEAEVRDAETRLDTAASQLDDARRWAESAAAEGRKLQAALAAASEAQAAANLARAAAVKDVIATQHEITALKTGFGSRRKNFQAVQDELGSVQQEIAAFRSSRTWRWSAPLRRLIGLISRTSAG